MPQQYKIMYLDSTDQLLNKNELDKLVIWLRNKFPITTPTIIYITDNKESNPDNEMGRISFVNDERKEHIITIHYYRHNGLHDILHTIIHEFIHAWQYDRGDVKLWRRVLSLNALPYKHRPWEIEAWRFAIDILRMYNTKADDESIKIKQQEIINHTDNFLRNTIIKIMISEDGKTAVTINVLGDRIVHDLI